MLPKWKVLVGEGKNHTLGREVKTRWSEFEVVRIGKKDVLRFKGVGGRRACRVPGWWGWGYTCELLRGEQRMVLMGLWRGGRDGSELLCTI